MNEKNDGKINELDLFHGTQKTCPQIIYASRIGFDVRHSNNGLWGQANYFAQKSSYSGAFAHKISDTSITIWMTS